jgi:hypothetical protein
MADDLLHGVKVNASAPAATGDDKSTTDKASVEKQPSTKEAN